MAIHHHGIYEQASNMRFNPRVLELREFLFDEDSNVSLIYHHVASMPPTPIKAPRCRRCRRSGQRIS
jgi:hypothetical protein